MKSSSISPLNAAAIALLFTLAACTSTNTGDALGSADQNKNVEDEVVDLRAYCPKTTIRAGTETMREFARGVDRQDADAAAKLRYQATINEVVRECNYIAETLAMRIGIAGRVIIGPVGEPGSQELPIRVAVTRGDEVLYSQLHKITTTIEAGKSIATFRFVDEAVNIDKPDKQNIVIYVGFDEGPVKKKN
ncbi:MAG: hypothetical protein L3J32_00810 [Rhizobiaceae bacterium]|nr:hypothetical protein [Rhizobiaceae bacterium]